MCSLRSIVHGKGVEHCLREGKESLRCKNITQICCIAARYVVKVMPNLVTFKDYTSKSKSVESMFFVPFWE